jgi:hypothetical protein
MAEFSANTRSLSPRDSRIRNEDVQAIIELLGLGNDCFINGFCIPYIDLVCFTY